MLYRHYYTSYYTSPYAHCPIMLALILSATALIMKAGATFLEMWMEVDLVIPFSILSV
jgi:hypothetical protein